MSKCSIFLRIRPFPDDEHVLKANSSTEATLEVPPSSVRAGSKAIYSFTKVFNIHSTQNEVYEESVCDCVDSFLKGTDCLFLAYGVTGSGKTFTLKGSREQPGIIPRSLRQIFNSVDCYDSGFVPTVDGHAIRAGIGVFDENSKKKHSLIADISQEIYDYKDSIAIDSKEKSSVWVNCIEIYKETITDLFGDLSTSLRLHETGLTTYVGGINEINVRNLNEAMQLYNVACQRLRVASTHLNDHSSRSHCVFTIKLLTFSQSGEFVRSSFISFCDLAGSERIVKTGVDRPFETTNINRSLLTINKCIMRLQQSQKKNSKEVLPVRESKLTWLFRSFFTGSAGKLAMMICASPSADLYNETAHTLKFAATARYIRESSVSSVFQHSRLRQKKSSRINFPSISTIEDMADVSSIEEEDSAESGSESDRDEEFWLDREEKFRKAIDTYTNIIEELNGRLLYGDEKIEKLKKEKSSLINNYHNLLAKQRTDFRNILSRGITEQRNIFNKRIELLLAEREEMISNLCDKSDIFDTSSSDQAELRLRIEDLENELFNAYESKCDKGKDDLVRVDHQHSDLLKKIAALENEIEKLSNSIEEKCLYISTLEITNENLKNELKNGRNTNELEDLNKKLASFKEDQLIVERNYLSSLENLEKENEKCTLFSKQINNDNEQLKSHIKKLEEMNSSILLQAESKFQETLEKLEKDNKLLHCKNGENEDKIGTLNACIKQLEDEKELLKAEQLNGKGQNIEDQGVFEKRIIDLNSTLESLQRSFHTLEAENDSLLKTNSQIHKENLELKQCIEQLNEDKENIIMDHSKIKRTINEQQRDSEKHVCSLMNKINSLEMVSEQLQTQNKKILSDSEVINKENDKLTTRIQDLVTEKEQLAKVHSELERQAIHKQQHFKDHISGLNSKIETLETNFGKLEEEKANFIICKNQFNDEKEKLNRDIDTLKNTIEQHEEDACKVERKIIDIQENSKKEIDDLNLEIQSLRDKLTMYSKQNEETNIKYEGVKVKNKQLEFLITELGKTNDRSALRDEVQILKDQLASVKKSFETEKALRDIEVSRVKTLEEELESTQSSIRKISTRSRKRRTESIDIESNDSGSNVKILRKKFEERPRVQRNSSRNSSRRLGAIAEESPPLKGNKRNAAVSQSPDFNETQSDNENIPPKKRISSRKATQRYKGPPITEPTNKNNDVSFTAQCTRSLRSKRF